jgi:hypothetical protein
MRLLDLRYLIPETRSRESVPILRPSPFDKLRVRRLGMRRLRMKASK